MHYYVLEISIQPYEKGLVWKALHNWLTESKLISSEIVYMQENEIPIRTYVQAQAGQTGSQIKLQLGRHTGS